jgi:hypothetical protein
MENTFLVSGDFQSCKVGSSKTLDVYRNFSVSRIGISPGDKWKNFLSMSVLKYIAYNAAC